MPTTAIWANGSLIHSKYNLAIPGANLVLIDERSVRHESSENRRRARVDGQDRPREHGSPDFGIAEFTEFPPSSRSSRDQEKTEKLLGALIDELETLGIVIDFCGHWSERRAYRYVLQTVLRKNTTAAWWRPP